MRVDKEIPKINFIFREKTYIIHKMRIFISYLIDFVNIIGL